MKNSFSPKYKPLMIYAVIFAGFIISGGIVATYFWGEISAIGTTRQTLTNEITSLTERKNVLQNVDNLSTVATDRAQMVLPTVNSSLAIVAQVRAVATEQGLVIKNLDLIAQPEVSGQLAQSVLNFDVEGPALGVMKFLEEIRRVAPIVSVDTVSLVSSSALLGANAIISIRSPWSELPTKLPSLTETITVLDPQEMALSEELANFRFPFTTGTESSSTSGQIGRENPFE